MRPRSLTLPPRRPGTAGLPAEDVTTLRRSALVEDLGHLGVSNAIWDKQGPLSQSEVERVRLHPYLTERMLSFSPALAPLGTLAALHHERLDGSGYPRGLSGDAIAPAGRDPRGRRCLSGAHREPTPPSGSLA